MQSLRDLIAASKRLVQPVSSKVSMLISQGQVRLTNSKSKVGGGGSGSGDRGAMPPDIGDIGGGERTMKSWQIHSYGGPSELQLSSSVKIPPLYGPEEVLVKVRAASVNPIDLAMTNGYGAETINILRDLCPSANNLSSAVELPQKLASYLMSPVAGKKSVIEFPLTLGRDFSGTVAHIGHGVKSDIKVGDEVYGVVGVQRQGSHAEYVVAQADTIRRKPSNIGFAEAASIPYVGLTAWSAIRVTGAFFDLVDKKFLVFGGSGGVGTFAIQYLRSQNAAVVATCSSDAADLVKSIGANSVIDYRDPEALRHIKDLAPYDCILHLSGPSNVENSMTLTKFLRPVTGQFITLSPPFLSNLDRYGLVGGAAKSVSDLLLSNVKTWTDAKAMTKWSFFIPTGEPLKNFTDLIELGQIKPIVQSVYKFSDLPEAYQKLEEGHVRGKIVVEL